MCLTQSSFFGFVKYDQLYIMVRSYKINDNFRAIGSKVVEEDMAEEERDELGLAGATDEIDDEGQALIAASVETEGGITDSVGLVPFVTILVVGAIIYFLYTHRARLKKLPVFARRKEDSAKDFVVEPLGTSGSNEDERIIPPPPLE